MGSPPLSLSPILDCSCLKGVIIREGGLASLEREVLRLDLRILPFYLLVPVGLWLYLPTEESCLLFFSSLYSRPEERVFFCYSTST